ncbi:hypothetical protein [Candidatus Odyssella acanthamoebae]|uniref:hypothetical protein n=1 Tax=Candidatus Odyssella acanthamoebae TaxID=91604 RepID=UPI0005706270|nr:hypothetical protein [Candidatus Paracaedibacter acanthamoebae]
MFFRKIVSSLVIVSYTKLVIASSFAVEAEFQKASHILKLSIDRTVDSTGNSTFLDLRVVKQDIATGEKEDLPSAQVDFEEQSTTGTIVPVVGKNDTCSWFEWMVPDVGIIKVDLNGNIVLQGVTHQSPTSLLKIKTSHLITLRNCAIHNLHLSSHAALLEGNNRLTNYKANHTFGITAFNGGQEQLKNLLLKQGRFLNATTLSVQGEGIWDLRGNSFVNQGNLIIGAQGHTINNASLVSNLGCIQGGQLQLWATNYLNSGTLDLAKLRIHTRENMINQGQIHTAEEGIYRFGSQLINSGQITSDNTYLFASTRAIGTLINKGSMSAPQGNFKSLKLINNQDIGHQRTLLQDSHLTNTQSIELGEIQSTSILLTLLNSGSLTGSGTLTLRAGENSGAMTVTDLVFTPSCDPLSHSQPFKNSGSLRGQTVTSLGQALANQGQCEMEVLTLNNGAKLTNGAGGELDIDLLFLPAGILHNEGMVRVQALDGESLDHASLIENSGRLELSHILQNDYQDLDGRILALILNNNGQFIANSDLVYDYFRIYRGHYLSRSLNRNVNVKVSPHQGYYPSNPPQRWFIDGRVSAPSLRIKHLPLADEFLRTLSRTHVIDESTTWAAWIYLSFYNSIVSQSHDLSSLGHLILEGWHPIATLAFQDNIITKGISLRNFNHISIEKSLRATTGNIKVDQTDALRVGVDNDHLGELRADQGEIDVQVNNLADLRYAKAYAKNKLEIESLNKTVQFGERVIVPAHEVAQKVPSDPNEFMGRATFGSASRSTEFYLPNKSCLHSETNRVVLKAKEQIEGQFGSVFGGQGFHFKAADINLLNTNLFLLGDSTIEANSFHYHRTPNVKLSFGNIGDTYNINYTVQTSHVARLFLLGNLNLLAPHFDVSGNDGFISGDLIRYGQILDDQSEFIRFKSYLHFQEYFKKKIVIPVPMCFGRHIRIEFPYKADCVGTSGGNFVLGQRLSLDRGGELSVEGGDLSAQHIRANLSAVQLQALRAAIQRAPSQITRLDTEMEVMAQGNPLINQTAEGRLIVGTEDSTIVQRPLHLPFLDPVRGVLTLTLPQDIDFRMDPTLEALSLMYHFHRTTGRVYDNQGNSGVAAYKAGLTMGRGLALLGIPLTPQWLGTLNTVLLFYQTVSCNGQQYLVPHAYIPQTTQADRVQRNGALQSRTMDLTAGTNTSQGGTLSVAGPQASMNLNFGRQESRSANIPGVGSIAPQEINENGDLNKTLRADSTLTDLTMSAPQGNAHLKGEGNVTLVNSTLSAGHTTTVEVDHKLTLKSSSAVSDQGPTRVTVGDLEMETLIETIYTSNGYYQRAARDATLGSNCSLLSVQVANDAEALGALFYGTAIDFTTGGTRHFGAVAQQGASETHTKKKSTYREWCTYHLTRLLIKEKPDNGAAEPSSLRRGMPLRCPSREEQSLTDFYENPVSSAGNDCAFNCLGISREEALTLLLSLKDKPEARQIVAPEIRLAYIAGDLDLLPGFATMPAYQSLKAYKGLLQSLTQTVDTGLRSALGLTDSQSWKDAYTSIQTHNLQDQYSDFMEKANHYLTFDAELGAFAERPEVYERYLYSYVDTNKMMGYQFDQFDARLGVWKRSSSAFDLLARQLGQKLRIMFNNKETGAFDLIHEDDFDGEPITLLHTRAGTQDGFSATKEETETALNHFNVLLTADQQQNLSADFDRKAADGAIYISSEGNALDEGIVMQSLTGVTKKSGGVLIETIVQNWMREQTISRKKKWTSRTKRVQTTHFIAQSQACKTTAPQGEVEFLGGKGLFLTASEIRARKIRLQAVDGVINLLTALDIDSVETKKRSKDAVWKCQSQTFDYHETRRPCQLFYDEEEGGIEFLTPEGIVVEMVQEKHSRTDGDKNQGRPREWQRLKDYSNLPGYEWMKLLDEREDVVRIYVDERHDSGRFAHQGMSAAAKVVASIVLTICTGGAGSLLTMVTSSLMNSMIINTLDQRGRVDRAAKITFSKESLKGLGAQILGQALLSGVDALGETLSKAASTTAQTATQTVTQATTKAATHSVTWVDRFQKALSTSLKTNLANGAARGLVYGNWRDQLKEAGINFVTDTAAQFGAEQIGVGRKEEIKQDLKAGQIDLYNYLSHKVSHAALGAATRAANAKLSGGNRKEVKKAAKGGAIGAASAEMLAEAMMPSALKRIENRLAKDGLTPGTQAYTKGHQTLLAEELKNLKACGEIAAVITAQAIGGDIEAAQLAARNALTYNSAHVLTGLSIISDTATADFFEQYKQAEEDEATCVQAEAELEKALQDWKELKDTDKRLQKGRYQEEQGTTASVTDAVSALLFDVASRDKRVATTQGLQAMGDKVRGLINQYEDSFSNRTQLIERYPLINMKELSRASIVDQAKETLAKYTQPVLGVMSESSNASLQTMAMMGASTLATSRVLAPQASLSGTMAVRAAAIGGGEATLGSAMGRGMARAPKNPIFGGGAVVAGSVGYGVHRVYEYYKETQRASADQATAYREDLRQGYSDIQASRSQNWMSQNAHAYPTGDVPIPGLYNPRTDKGKEKLTDHDISTFDAHAANARWVDLGFDTHTGRVQILSTPLPEPSQPILEGFDQSEILKGYLEGYDHIPPTIGITLEGFDIYNGPEMNVLTSDNAENHTSTQITSDLEKWAREPSSIQDQMALEAARRGEGKRIIKNLNDPLYKGMEKMEYKVKSATGKDSVVHYVRDPKTGKLMDFKFKKRSID